jgi:hypothetical protein
LTAAGLNEVASQADTDTNTTYSIGDGGLTTNDFTNADHSKLNAIEASANNYTLPSNIAAASLDISGNIDVDGAVDMASTLAVAGEITANGGISLVDNKKLTFGTGDDLEVYHDGNNSYINDVGTGNIFIRGANVVLTTGAGTKYLEGGSNVLRLYHTGNQRMQTSAAGISVTGSVTADGGNSGQWNTAYGWGNHASQSYATQSYVGTQISNLVDSSPATLNTLNELAAALGDDPNFAATVSASIGTKLPLAGGTLTGNLSVATKVFTPFIGSAADTDTNIYFPASNQMRFLNGGVETFRTLSTGAVFNEGGADLDFRVESDTNANALFVQGSDGRIGVGTGTSLDNQLEVAGGNVRVRGTTTPSLKFNNNELETIAIKLNSGSTGTLGLRDNKVLIDSNGGFITTPAANGHAVFNEGGVDADFRVESNANGYALFVDGGTDTVSIGTAATDAKFRVAASNADMRIGYASGYNYFDADVANVYRVGTSGVEAMKMTIGEIVLNETGADRDFRVESDNNSSMIHVEASTNRVGIGIASPRQTLDVVGSIFASGYYITALQGNSQLTNASTSSGSNPSYIGQGLISVTVSDAKSKENFGAVEENECLNKVVSLAEHVKKFDWIDEDWKKEKGRTVGMVAQEVYEDHSEFVHKPENYNDEGWAIRHQEMVPTLVKAIQEQQSLIETLTARIAALEE